MRVFSPAVTVAGALLGGLAAFLFLSGMLRIYKADDWLYTSTTTGRRTSGFCQQEDP